MLKVKDYGELAIFSALIYSSELALSFLPNFSFTPLLFAVYFYTRNRYNSLLLILIYILLQGIIWSFNFYLISMYMGWVVWLILVNLLKMKYNLGNLVFISIMFGVVYGLSFLPLTWLVYRIDPWVYIIADIPFQLNMIISNLITMLLLFDPLVKVFKIATKEI